MNPKIKIPLLLKMMKVLSTKLNKKKHRLNAWSINFPLKVVNYVMGTISSYEKKMIEFGKESRKTSRKYKLEYCDVITLLLLLGVNRHIPLLYIYKIFVYINTAEECIKQFTIGYTINPTLHVNRVFRYQVEKFSKYFLNQSTMKGEENVMRKRIHALFY